MKKNKPSEKKINWNSIKDKKIPRSTLTVGEFFNRLEENPASIADFDIRDAIDQLQRLYIHGTRNVAKLAGEILKSILIPKRSTLPKTTDWKLNFWQNRPDTLIQDILHYEDRMKPGWKKGRTKEERRRQAVKCLIGRTPTDEDMEGLLLGKKDESFRDFVLLVFAQVEEIRFVEQFKKFYYSIPNLKQKREKYKDLKRPPSERRIKTKGATMSELEKTTAEAADMLRVDYLNLIQEKGLDYFREGYEYAYWYYKYWGGKW
ncbi:MAG: hypothetical protein ACM3SR_08080 [Ignavibacteriales bacterium]